MGMPFRDITIYIKFPASMGEAERWAESSLKNFVSDLYMQKMHSYKPPGASRICIQPEFLNTWDSPWKNGSIAHVAVEFIQDKYESFDKASKYRYVLNMIQEAVLQLSDEYNWDKQVFINAYQEVLASDFIFKLDYPAKASRDRKKTGFISIEKTETITTAYVNISHGETTTKMKLFDKRNSWWYDCVYTLVKHAKWKDVNSFGFFYPRGELEIYYSISDEKVYLLQAGVEVPSVDFSNIFLLQLP